MMKFGLYYIFIVIYEIGFAVGEASDIHSTGETCKPGSCTFLPQCSGSGCNILYRNPEDCRSFYRCCEGTAQFHKCSEGLVFNADRLTCDYAQNYDCARIVSDIPDSTESFIASSIKTDPTIIRTEITDNDLKVTETTLGITEKISTYSISEEHDITDANTLELSTQTQATDADFTETTKKSSNDFEGTVTNVHTTVSIPNTETDNFQESSIDQFLTSFQLRSTTDSKLVISYTTSNNLISDDPSTIVSTLSDPTEGTTTNTKYVVTLSNSTEKFSESSTTEPISVSTDVFNVTSTEIPIVSTSSNAFIDTTKSETFSTLLPVISSTAPSLNSTDKSTEYTDNASGYTDKTTEYTDKSTESSEATYKSTISSNISLVTTAEIPTVSPTISNTASTSNSTDKYSESSTTMLSSTNANVSFVTTSVINPSNLTSTTKYPNVCLEFNCPSTFGLYPDPKNCSKFFHCSHSVAYHKDCPATLHFNPVLDVCDWPYRAGCDNTEASYTKFPNSSPCANCNNCTIPDKYNCTNYIQCTNGTAYNMRCPIFQSFDSQTLKCMDNEYAKCNLSKVTCPNQDGVFPTTDCRKFVQCSNGIPYEKECPSGLYFNKELMNCDWERNANENCTIKA